MESNVGIVRDAGRLAEAVTRLQEILAELPAPTCAVSGPRHATSQRAGWPLRCSALARTESRGGHYRSDFPARDDVNFRKHSVMIGDRGALSITRSASGLRFCTRERPRRSWRIRKWLL